MTKSLPGASGLTLAVQLAELREEPIRFHIVATADERSALALRFSLRGLERLEADVSVALLKGGAAMRVEGRLQGDLVQDCVVTLEPVAQHIDEPFRLDFGEPADVIDVETGDLVVAADENAPEPLPVGTLDLGELLAEQLALSIDPYPRKPGADLQAVMRKHGLEAQAGKASPFAALAALKRKG